MSKGVNKNGALVIIPPKDHWKIIQKIRRKYDKTYLKWPPHINLIWPFVFAEDFYRNFGKLEEILGNFPPIKLKCEKIDFLDDENGSKVNKNCSNIYSFLPFSGENEIKLLQKELMKIFAEEECAKDDHNINFRSHLTVGHLSIDEFDQLVEEYSDQINFEFTLDKIYFISREDSSSPFSVSSSISLSTNYIPDIVNNNNNLDNHPKNSKNKKIKNNNNNK